jgi:hypothetical protein
VAIGDTGAVDPLLRKLNLGDASEVAVVGAPEDMSPVLERFAEHATVTRDLTAGVTFVLAFVRTAADISRRAGEVAAATEGDAKVWMAYPKTSSPLHDAEVSRDESWAPMGAAGFEPVRQVAIDDDWSAVRFRRVEFIERLTRDPSRAITGEGRRRASGGRRPA